MLIVLDPGHGGKDPGAVGPTGLYEKTVVLDIALRLGALLKQKGIDVLYTRSTDTFVELSTRAEIANKSQADYFISLHANSASNRGAEGTETYVYLENSKASKIAQEVQSALIKENQLINRGVKTANFAVLRETTMPALLVEIAFISNPKEEALLRQPQFLEQTAKGIANGLFAYLGITTSPHWGQSAIDELLRMGLITENKDPASSVTWAEFATVLLRVLKLPK